MGLSVATMAGLLSPLIKEKFMGRAEVRDTFVIPKQGTVAVEARLASLEHPLGFVHPARLLRVIGAQRPRSSCRLRCCMLQTGSRGAR